MATILLYLVALTAVAGMVVVPLAVISERRIRRGLRAAADSEAAFEGRMLALALDQTQLTRETFEAAEARAFDAAAERKARRLKVISPEPGSAAQAVEAFRSIKVSKPGDAATLAEVSA